MIDEDHLTLLIYNHAAQLTLIEYPPTEALTLAYTVAALAFDADLTRAGLEAARKAALAGSSAKPLEMPTPAKASGTKQ